MLIPPSFSYVLCSWDIINRLSSLKPETLSLQDVIKWEQLCADDKLAKAILNDLISHASLGLSFLAMANTVHSATSERACTQKATKKSALLWTSLVAAIRQVEGNTKDISYLWKQLNSENVSPGIPK